MSSHGPNTERIIHPETPIDGLTRRLVYDVVRRPPDSMPNIANGVLT
jgi:hypothetical protein